MSTDNDELILGIETSCDETAAAVVRGGTDVVSSVVSSQVDLHARYGGVVPEIASRAHVELLTPVIAQALVEAGVDSDDLTAVAATHGPGLVGSLLVGVSAAKALALVWDKPFVAVNHLEAHLYASFLEEPDLEMPMVVLLVSGGHTMLVLMHDHAEYEVLGSTLDDAAGEAYDKVGKLMGLDYPAGPRIDRAAAGHEGERVPFKRARIKVDGGRGVTHRAFSFSGIKTAVRQHLQREGLQPLAEGEALEERPDLLAVLAGFQETVVDMLVKPTLRIAREDGLSHLVVVGGVSANSALRRRLAEDCAAAAVELIVPRPRWSTDNAAMIAAAGALQLAAGERAPLDLRADPALPLGVVA